MRVEKTPLVLQGDKQQRPGLSRQTRTLLRMMPSPVPMAQPTKNTRSSQLLANLSFTSFLYSRSLLWDITSATFLRSIYRLSVQAEMRRFHVNGCSFSVCGTTVTLVSAEVASRSPGPGLASLHFCNHSDSGPGPGHYSGRLAVPPALSIHLALLLSVPPSAGGISGFRSVSFHWLLCARHRAKYFSSVSRYLTGRW